MFKKFLGFATSDRHNSAMIRNAQNSQLNGPRKGCLVFIITVRINSTSFPSAVRCTRAVHPPSFFGDFDYILMVSNNELN